MSSENFLKKGSGKIKVKEDLRMEVKVTVMPLLEVGQKPRNAGSPYKPEKARTDSLP